MAGLVSAAAGSSGAVYPRLFVGTSVLTALVALVLALAINEARPMLKEPAQGGETEGRLRVALSDGPFLVLLGVGVLLYCGFSPIVAGTLLEARLPALIWTIQFADAASAAVGLGALLRRRRSVPGA